MNIYVGNLSFEVNEEDLRTEFAAFGKVESVNIIKDKYTGRSRGFAFVVMPIVSEGQQAITSLNGKTIKNRAISVNAARERTEERDRSRGYDNRRSSFGDDRRGGFRGGSNRRF